MKLLGLHLLAYGPFTDVELDLVPQGVHVVYGKNEAGKSTALRAITGLLYGIAKNTPDAHAHKMPDLRVGGSFRVPDGGTVYLVRRKGKENTLLDRDGRPVDEAVLARLLGGVSEEQFLTMFGLDHETLRRGGEALLLGKGNLGESLFGAATAGGEVHQVLRGLRAEAEALFTPKAHARPLNEAIKTWSEAHRRVRDTSTSPDSVLEQERNLADLKRERADCESERQGLQIEYAKLQRACRALPVIAKYRLLEERRAALGDVVRLPSDAASERVQAMRTAQESTAEITRLEALVSRLSAQRRALVIPESLALLDEVPLDLANRLGSHRKAAEDMPRIETEARDLEDEARRLLAKTGRRAELHEAETWRIDAVQQASIRKLAIERTSHAAALAKARRALEVCEARRADLVTRRDALAPAPDVGALKKATSRAERAGPLDERLASAVAQAARVEKRAEALLSSLGLHGVSLAAAAGLPVVSGETLERFARDFEAAERDATSLDAQVTDLEARAANLAREIAAVEFAGKVPTERDLLDARERREKTWRTLERAGRMSKPISRDVLSAFESEVRAADEIADRLRHEAERVGNLAALLAERESCGERRATLAERRIEIDRRRQSLADAWRALWNDMAAHLGPPSEMKAWLAGHAALVRTADELRAIEAEAAAVRAAIATYRGPIADRLQALGSPAPSAASLGELIDRAEELIEAAEVAAVERREVDRDIEEIDAELVLHATEQRDIERADARLRAAWQATIGPIGTSEDASVDEVILTIDLLAEMFHKIDQAAAARRRARGIARDAKIFAEDVKTLSEHHAPDLIGGAPDAVAAAILDRFHRGRSDLAERRAIDRQLSEATELLARQSERAHASDERLAELMAAAHAETIADLESAERRSEEAREIDVRIKALDGELLALNLAMGSLPGELLELDLDMALARSDEVAAELEELRQRASVIDQRIGGNEQGQKKLDHPRAGAADAALDAEAALAKVRELAERYARVKIASVLLAREIERYRQQHQGPILKRASTLFARLTLHSFSGLKTDFDEKDEPILLGVRQDGREIGVEAMSDGTRDQLYLALYLATLERFAEGGDSMPLIVDDVLIHFDDDRARAALEVLGELSQHTQVLFFTHHARLVELAREAIPTGRLFIRELESAPRTIAN